MGQVRIVGGQGEALRNRLFQELKANAGCRRVVFVPEQYTLQTEKDLILGMGLPGLLDLEVVSPTKLKTVVSEAAGISGLKPLDERGRAMAIQQALNECGSDLKYYGNLERYFGAVSKMDETLAEMRESGLTADVLARSAEEMRGAQKARVKDLVRIWETYDALLEGRFEDPADTWRETCLRLKRSGVWHGTRVWIYGFDAVRPNLRELIQQAAGECGEMTVLLTMTPGNRGNGRIFQVQHESARELVQGLRERGIPCGTEWLSDRSSGKASALRFLEEHFFSGGETVFREDPGPAVSLFEAASPTAEAWNCAETLLKWHGEGIPWHRMSVALPDSFAGNALTAALRMNGIPFFTGEKEPAARHGVCRLLLAALDCAGNGYTTEKVIQAALSGYGTLTAPEGARLENYAVTRGIEYGKWKQPFTHGEEAGEMEVLRGRLTEPIDRLHSGLREARTGAESVEAVVRFLEEEGVWDQLKERQRQLREHEMYAEAVVDRQIWENLMNTLDQLWMLLGPRRAGLKDMARLIEGALERSRISSLPEEEQGVSVGKIGHMLTGETDAMILMGLNEGILNVGETGLLSDADRARLRETTGTRVGMEKQWKAMMIRSDYYRTMTLPARRLRLSYSLRQEDGTGLPAGEPVTELRRIFPGLREEGGLRAEGVPDEPQTPWTAMKGLGPRLRELREGQRKDLEPEWKDALRLLCQDGQYGAALQEMIRQTLPEDGTEKIRPEAALRLFRGEKTSVSRLESYASCPYRFFLDHGIRPLLREAWAFSAQDAGTFFHRALQEYLNQAEQEEDWPGLSDEQVDRLMDGVLARLTEEWKEGPLEGDAAGLWQGEEYLRRARHAAAALTRFAENSSFRVIGTEMEFGGEGALAPMVLTLKDGTKVALEGKIDRLDAWETPDGPFLRVLDFKSSEKELVPAKMDRGEQLQLMIYLRAAERGIPGARAAGAQYFPVQDREVEAETAAEAEKERLSKVRYRGVVLAEEEVIRAMERAISPYSMGKVLNQDGSVSRQAPWALSREALRDLMDAALEKAEELCESIRAGEIPVSPSAEDDQRSACTFCDYASVCGRRKDRERPLDKGLTFPELAEKYALRKAQK